MNKPPASVAQYLGAIGAHKGNGVMSDAKRWAFFKPGIPEEVRQFLRESGAKGGAAGKGKPRGFATLTPTQRRELAKAAARQKWKDKRSADSEKNQAAVELGR